MLKNSVTISIETWVCSSGPRYSNSNYKVELRTTAVRMLRPDCSGLLKASWPRRGNELEGSPIRSNVKRAEKNQPGFI